MRLGLAGRLFTQPAAHDQPEAVARGARSFGVRLAQLQQVLLQLQQLGISCYRLPSDLVPADPHELDVHHRLLDQLQQQVKVADLRLTFHLELQHQLTSPDDAITSHTIGALHAKAALLQRLGMGPIGTIVMHLGGTAGDPAGALQRFARRYEQLPWWVRQRIAIELDHGQFSLGQLLYLHQQVGVPIVFDTLHFQINNPEQISLPIGVGLALASWPVGVRPKMHLSSQRTEAHVFEQRRQLQLVVPQSGQHADFINLHDFIALEAAVRGYTGFDLMVEAKAGERALRKLRDDWARYQTRREAGDAFR